MQTSHDYLLLPPISQTQGPVHIEPCPLFLCVGYIDAFWSDARVDAAEICRFAFDLGMSPESLIRSINRIPTVNCTWDEAMRAVEAESILMAGQAYNKADAEFLKTIGE